MPTSRPTWAACASPSRPGARRGDATWTRFRPELEPYLDRSLGAFDGAEADGTMRGIPFRLTVPGGRTVAADGVTMVTVAALGSAYLGGHRLATLALAGAVAERRSGAGRPPAGHRPSPALPLHF